MTGVKSCQYEALVCMLAVVYMGDRHGRSVRRIADRARSLKNADQLARRVEVGMLWINMPAMPSAKMRFGGIKDSGYGSEGGPEALEAYLNVRSVAVMNV